MENEKKILIVEDEAIIALELESRLENMGFSVVGTAFSGEEAIESAEKTPPDALIVDIGLSGEIDGLEVSEKIARKLDIPVLFVTGYSKNSLEDKLEQLSPDLKYNYIIKPFGVDELLTKIEKLMS